MMALLSFLWYRQTQMELMLVMPSLIARIITPKHTVRCEIFLTHLFFAVNFSPYPLRMTLVAVVLAHHKCWERDFLVDCVTVEWGTQFPCCCNASCSIEETVCHHLHKGLSKKGSGGCSLCCDSSVSWAAGSGVLTAEEGAAAFREQLPSCSARFVMVSRCSFLNVTDPFSRTSTRFL